ncbi:MAG: dihydroneopterin aldolase [Candidatus Nanopelagicaceae bacterium]|nr:dihydroneopterin aldolase [Candidatus Nanopelagicaceae bacterium]
MSDSIEIKGIRGFGYHGVFDHERENGQEFLVDISLNLDLRKAAGSDAVDDTVDYGSVCNLVLSAIVGPPVALIEKLASQIADLLLTNFSLLDSVVVVVHKPQAPVEVNFEDIAIRMERSR